MVTSKDFVERSIAHQLGPDTGCDFSLEPAVFEFVANASSGMALSWDHGNQTPRDLNDWKPSNDSRSPWNVRHKRHSKTNKTSGALQDILGAGADFDFLLDMQDHRSRLGLKKVVNTTKSASKPKAVRASASAAPEKTIAAARKASDKPTQESTKAKVAHG